MAHLSYHSSETTDRKARRAIGDARRPKPSKLACSVPSKRLCWHCHPGSRAAQANKARRRSPPNPIHLQCPQPHAPTHLQAACQRAARATSARSSSGPGGRRGWPGTSLPLCCAAARSLPRGHYCCCCHCLQGGCQWWPGHQLAPAPALLPQQARAALAASGAAGGAG